VRNLAPSREISHNKKMVKFYSAEGQIESNQPNLVLALRVNEAFRLPLLLPDSAQKLKKEQKSSQS
jgi:hypothetical protein